ncbi:MAG: hypothetical protein HQL31_12740, partial [Planctomycetes bacterium]|nr:hypothetical protein [Planctomycetota bacterium]
MDDSTLFTLVDERGGIFTTAATKSEAGHVLLRLVLTTLNTIQGVRSAFMGSPLAKHSRPLTILGTAGEGEDLKFSDLTRRVMDYACSKTDALSAFSLSIEGEEAWEYLTHHLATGEHRFVAAGLRSQLAGFLEYVKDRRAQAGNDAKHRRVFIPRLDLSPGTELRPELFSTASILHLRFFLEKALTLAL